MRVIIVRHAQSLANIAIPPWDQFGDAPLSTAGEMQAEHLASRLLRHFGSELRAAVVSSATLRGVQTALPLARAGIAQAPIVLTDIGEIHVAGGGGHATMIARTGCEGERLFFRLLEGGCANSDTRSLCEEGIRCVRDQLPSPVVDQASARKVLAVQAALACEQPTVILVSHSHIINAAVGQGTLVPNASVVVGVIDRTTLEWTSPPEVVRELETPLFEVISRERVAREQERTDRLLLGCFPRSLLITCGGGVTIFAPYEWIKHSNESAQPPPDAPIIMRIGASHMYHVCSAHVLSSTYPSHLFEWKPLPSSLP